MPRRSVRPVGPLPRIPRDQRPDRVGKLYEPEDAPCAACGEPTEILGARLCFSCQQGPPPTGSVSSGTLRTADLVVAFLETLEALDPEAAAELREDWGSELLEQVEAASMEVVQPDLPEAADWLLEELFAKLENRAPEGTYFGSHPGDGADFGFWPFEE